MRVFQNFNNDSVLESFSRLLGVDFTGEVQEIPECHGAVLVARSLAGKMGTENSVQLLDSVLGSELPCIVIGPERSNLVIRAKEMGLPNENIVVPREGNISASAIFTAFMEVSQGNWQVVFDVEDFQLPGYEPNSPECAKCNRVDPATVPDCDACDRVESGTISDCDTCTKVDPATVPNCASCPKVDPSDQHVFQDGPVPTPDIVFFGVKGGVGTSTAVALACAMLSNSLHLEVTGGRPSSDVYHANGYGYLAWKSGDPISSLDGKMVIADLTESAPVDVKNDMIAQARCVVMVADRSEASFRAVGDILKNGFQPDIFIVSGPFVAGPGVEVYKGEYGDLLPDALVEIPSGLDTEKVISKAQRQGAAPVNLEGSQDMDNAAGELAGHIRRCLADSVAA